MSASAVAGSEPEVAVASSSVISVQDLVHRYGDRTALNGVSFDVRPAELFGLLGPNGSGKTTLFRILSTLMIPVAGRALILGFDAVRDPNNLRRHIGVVFQAQAAQWVSREEWHPEQRGRWLSGLRGPAEKCPGTQN
jgi:ABC-type branched-subunit amino acid transport system ATPase component